MFLGNHGGNRTRRDYHGSASRVLYGTSKMKGVLDFHTETGTEGGYWAFQDERFIKQNQPFGYCDKCGIYFKYAEDHPEDLSEKQKSCIHEEYVGEMWDYKGLHILRDGDHLKIFSKDKPEEIVWEGIIRLYVYPPFTQNVFGLWIHSDQGGEYREKWAERFFENYPAELKIKGK